MLDPPPTGESSGEDRGPAKFLLGARYRVLVVPQFLINAFGVDGGRTVVVQGGGPEFGYAPKNFEILLSGWFAGYSLQETPFKGTNDGPDAWEIIESRLNMAYITADFLWKQNLAENLDLHIGVGAGVGVVFGEFSRNEAYFPAGIGDPYTDLVECTGPGDPSSACPVGGNYGVAEAWPAYPWLTFQTGLRYAPIREFIARLDLGISSSGFWFGLGADYGI